MVRASMKKIFQIIGQAERNSDC